jgi:hypothetical protein
MHNIVHKLALFCYNDHMHGNESYKIFQYEFVLERAVAQLLEALHSKPEGCGFDFRLCRWNFSLT